MTDGRYHALDSMRATMMMLGVYLHIVVGYSGDGNWPYIDPNPTPALNFTLGIIHAFRMPAFFVIAGFFGSLLWDRRGPAAFATNRRDRVLWPFLVFWTLLFPPTLLAVAGREGAAALWASGEIWARLHPMHLWFLEYLLLLYGIGAGMAWWAGRWPAGWMERIHRVYRWVLDRPIAPLAWALLSLGPLTWMRGNLKDCDGFVPELPILAAYVPPFAFGWLLYHHRERIDRFARGAWWNLAGAVAGYGVYRAGAEWRAVGNVLLCWFLIFACLGLFLRYCAGRSAVWRYLSDASYWVYILHLPVVVGLQFALKDVGIPALGKIPIVLTLSMAILLVSYDWLARPTWVGALLNGRRWPRGLPQEG